MSLSSFNNKVIELEKSVKRSKVRSIRKLTRQIEHIRKKNPDDERAKRKVNRIIEEIHEIRKLTNKDAVLFAIENEGTISELLKKYKLKNDDIKQHALIRVVTEKSLQADIHSLKVHEDYAKSWQPLLIMYRSRHEKRLVWKEKSQDFEKIEQALVEQQNELKEMEEKLPKPLKIKKKKLEKVEKKPIINRSKEALVCVLDLENKTAEPFGNRTIEDDDNDNEHQKDLPKVEETESKQDPTISPLSSATIVNDPFFLHSQHQITYQNRTSRNKNDTDIDDKTFIEHSYFIEALSSSSNRRDGKGEVAKKKWAHLSRPTYPRAQTKSANINGKFKNGNNNQQSNKKDLNEDNKALHPSWEASKQAKSQYSIKKSEAKRIVFNNSDDEDT